METYRVEMIPKKSVMDDIIDYWLATGRADNTGDGEFVFTGVADYEIDQGMLNVKTRDSFYANTLSDFYRVKVTPEKQGSLI
jgi:hypothetical protein